jgi:DNA-directed RNA polymerase subunit H (RpoH/RPB5)
VLLVAVLLQVWLLLAVFVGIDFLHDRYGAYQGKVVAIRSRTLLDHLAMEFIFVEHLVLKTPEGKTIDKMVGVENRAFFRIEVSDWVVKERGFGNHARVPGKLTVQEMLDSARETLR